MDSKTVFNITVCFIGIAFLLIHTVDLILKKGKRKDEKKLLAFISFTIFHFATYLTFTFIKLHYTSNPLIISFYTIFFIMNNIELILVFDYTITYVPMHNKAKNVLGIINLSIFLFFIALDIVNIFTHMFFYAENGLYVRAKLMIFSQGYQFLTFIAVFVIVVFNKKVGMSEKIAYSFYCALPIAAIIVQNLLPGYAIAYLSVTISIEILFFFVNVKKNFQLANEAKKNKEIEVKMMMSQIQPHFIYNTLASISTLIKIDPEKAQEALDNFTEYLRANLSSLSQTGLIPFKDELRHIETYLSLEKMRFDERLTVIYDIKSTEFFVPPLSIQPLVENAVKHGILKKIEGGVVEIHAYEKEGTSVVEIIDNGVGFNTKNLKEVDAQHIGLNNVKYRISTMCHGEMRIYSQIDKGTKIVVIFHK